MRFSHNARATVLHGSGLPAHWPLPRPGPGGADVGRASEVQHAVEGVGADLYLGDATPVRARAHLFGAGSEVRWSSLEGF